MCGRPDVDLCDDRLSHRRRRSQYAASDAAQTPSWPGCAVAVSSQPIAGEIGRTVVRHRRIPISSVLRDYWALSKPEVNFLIVITTFAGFCLSSASLSRDLAWGSMI